MLIWEDLHNPLHGAGYCLDPDFNAHDHVACQQALTDFFTLCDKIHGEDTAQDSAESAKAKLDWQCTDKAMKGPIFSTDAHLDKCH
jgi:hypothetical protein